MDFDISNFNNDWELIYNEFYDHVTTTEELL